MKPTMILMLASLLLFSCSDSSDPDTISRDKLSPPLNLVTVTGDSQVELRWNAQNFEDELQGYDVFMIENTSIQDLVTAATALPQYPADTYTAARLRDSSIPRCEDNNAFFTAFGITVTSDESCDSSIFLKKNATALQDEATASVVDAKVACYDPDASDTDLGNTNISVLKSSSEYQDGEGTQRCLVKGLTNGTNYTFMVVAVLGASFDEISWTSNLADDTPAPALYSAATTFTTDQYRTITFDTSAVTATVSDSTACGGKNLCNITSSNDETSAGSKIYIARDQVGSSHRQRMLLSTSNDASGNITFLERGPLTYDPVLGSTTVADRVPGDAAIDSSNYYAGGVILPFYENSVIDFAINDGTNINYGKIVFGTFSYASDTDKTSVLTTNVTVIMQGAAGVKNYFHPFRKN